nr:CaiB/BaiF CoA-transferase family protein [Bradyrhizobium sp. 2]
MMESLVPEYDLLGHVRTRTGGALPGISPSNTYPSSDGRHVVIAGNSDAIFKRLMLVIGRPDLADDPALASNDGRVRSNALLDAAITAWTSQRTMDEILARLDAADVPAGRIYSVADIVDDPHYAARDMILPTELPGDVTVKMPGIAPKLSDTPGAVKWPGPTLGQHTDEVLAGLGLQAGDIAQLRRSGAVQ